MSDLDEKLGTFLKSKTGLNTWPYQNYCEFWAHLFSHAVLGFFFGWYVSLGVALVKELIVDKHHKDFWKDEDGKTDLVARSVGALLPLLKSLY